MCDGININDVINTDAIAITTVEGPNDPVEDVEFTRTNATESAFPH